MIVKKRHGFTTYLFSGISAALSFVFFLFLLELIADYVKFSRGMRAWGAVFSMLPIGIAEFAFIVLISSHYAKRRKSGDLVFSFFRVTSVECFLFVFLEILRTLMLLPVIRDAGSAFYSFWYPLDFVNAIGGGVLGVCFGVLAHLVSRSSRGYNAKSP